MPDHGANDNYVRPMAWEWISPASGAALGLSAIISTTWVAVRSRKHDMAMAEGRQAHDRQIAHEQWIREHRHDAYLALLDLAERAGGLYVQRIHLLWAPPGSAAEPELPDHEAQLLVRAPIMAYGSEAVKERMDTWHGLVWKAIHAAADVRDRVEGAHGRLGELKAQELTARKALGNQIAAELQGNPGQEVERRPS